MKKFFSKIKSLLRDVYKDLNVLFLLSSIFLYIVLFKVNVLSLKIMIPIGIALLLINIFFNRVAFSKRLKKKFKVTGSVLTTILTIVFIVLSIVLINVFSSVKNMFSNKSTVTYSVLATKASGYKKIDDIDKKIVGFYEEDKYNSKAEKELSKKVEVEYIGYDTLDDLEYALLSDEVDAVMIMESYLDVIKGGTEEVPLEDITDIEEDTTTDTNPLKDKIENFIDDIKVIYTFKVHIDNSKDTKKIDLEKGAFAIYVSGQDSYAETVSDTSRSDVNLLMVVNIKKKQILLISIPRDYYVNISGKNSYDKLTHISLYGSDTAANSIGELLDVDVDHFVKFNFTTFMKAIEYMLPLDVYSDYDFTTGVYDQTIGNSYTFSKGYNHITSGEMALQFVRARKNFTEGDRQRGVNQARMLRAVIKKATKPSVLLKYNDILKALQGTFLTNISDDSITEIIKYLIDNNGKFSVSSYSLDGSDAHKGTYSTGSQAVYVMIPDEDTIEEAKGYIQDVLNGKKPNIEQDASELEDEGNAKDVSKTPYRGAVAGRSSSRSTTPSTTPTKPSAGTTIIPEEKEETVVDNTPTEETPVTPTTPTEPSDESGDSGNDSGSEEQNNTSSNNEKDS